MAVCLSGSGTTLENFFERVRSGELPAEVACVVSSRADAYGLTRARSRGVPAFVVPRRRYASLDAFTDAVFEPVRGLGAELVALAGFMVRVGVPPDYRGRIMNVHPALVPAFSGRGMYGHLVHEAVLASGVKITGCTVHFVDEEYDHGPIIIQRAVEVRDDDDADSLASRVQAEEREAYVEAVRLFAEGRLEVRGRRVIVRGA
jgi:formyltetrahydrofolate-dependent phosphoribosylglycinamide formyltransferase